LKNKGRKKGKEDNLSEQKKHTGSNKNVLFISKGGPFAPRTQKLQGEGGFPKKSNR